MVGSSQCGKRIGPVWTAGWDISRVLALAAYTSVEALTAHSSLLPCLRSLGQASSFLAIQYFPDNCVMPGFGLGLGAEKGKGKEGIGGERTCRE